MEKETSIVYVIDVSRCVSELVSQPLPRVLKPLKTWATSGGTDNCEMNAWVVHVASTLLDFIQSQLLTRDGVLVSVKEASPLPNTLVFAIPWVQGISHAYTVV